MRCTYASCPRPYPIHSSAANVLGMSVSTAVVICPTSLRSRTSFSPSRCCCCRHECGPGILCTPMRPRLSRDAISPGQLKTGTRPRQSADTNAPLAIRRYEHTGENGGGMMKGARRKGRAESCPRRLEVVSQKGRVRGMRVKVTALRVAALVAMT